MLPNVFLVEINRIKKIYDIQPINKFSIFTSLVSLAKQTISFPVDELYKTRIQIVT